MKTLLIFSNPFGFGPSGKAISIYKYINKNSKNVKVYLCGSDYLRQIAGKECNFINVDERSEESISDLVKKIDGEKYILGSQNRFSIKVAVKNHIPCAFIDGLSWFWNDIPQDHFLANIIFWLGYPRIETRIPSSFKHKIFIIHGITENLKKIKSSKRDGILIYIGGCKNPLAPFPVNYLDLVGRVLEHVISKGFRIELAVDKESQKYLAKYARLKKKIKNYNHHHFLIKLSTVEKFITNGGQTATIEASGFDTPTSFFLPINLSQVALIAKLNAVDSYDFSLNWNDYVRIPNKIYDYSEKNAIEFLNNKSKELLNESKAFNRLCDDLINLISKNVDKGNRSNFLHSIGSTGAEDIYEVLHQEWNI